MYSSSSSSNFISNNLSVSQIKSQKPDHNVFAENLSINAAIKNELKS
jgi:hypothetical protein